MFGHYRQRLWLESFLDQVIWQVVRGINRAGVACALGLQLHQVDH